MILVLAVLASACANVDFYVVFAKVEVRAGLHQIIYDYEASTSALRHLYPNLGSIEARLAWGGGTRLFRPTTERSRSTGSSW